MANAVGVDSNLHPSGASIILKTVAGDTTVIPFPAQANLNALREAVLKAHGVPKHRQSLLVNNVPLVDNQQLERALAQAEGNLTIVVLATNPSSTGCAQHEGLDEWFAQNNIPEALKEALYEEGFDTEETIGELTEDNLQSICAEASIRLTQGLQIKFRKLWKRLAMREIENLRDLHYQGCITAKELEVNRRRILAKHGITPEQDGDGIGEEAGGLNSGVTPFTSHGHPKLFSSAMDDQPLELRNLLTGLVVVCDSGNHRLQVVNPIDGSFVRSIGNGKGCGSNQFDQPCGITTLPNGHVVVCDYGNNRLQVVNPSDGSFVSSISKGSDHAKYSPNHPTAITTLPNGNVVACDFRRLQIVNPSDGSCVRSIDCSGPNELNSPGGVTTLPNGLIVVCDSDNHRLQVVNPNNAKFVRSINNGAGSGPNQFCFPGGVTTLRNGLVVVCDEYNHRLQVLDPMNGSFVRSISDGVGSGPHQFKNPAGVTTLPNGHVVVCDRENHRLQVVNPRDGSFVRSIGNGLGSWPNQFWCPHGVTLVPKVVVRE